MSITSCVRSIRKLSRQTATGGYIYIGEAIIAFVILPFVVTLSDSIPFKMFGFWHISWTDTWGALKSSTFIFA